MAGLGFIIGGALAGYGQGLAEQGKMDFEQRRNMALESLRNQNQQDNIRLQADQQRQTQQEAAKLDDWKDSRSNDRRTTSTMKIDTNRNALETAQRERLARLESTLKSDATAESARIEAKIRSGEIIDTIQDSSGNYYAIYRNGEQKPLNIKGALPASVAGGGSILERASGGANPGTQPATPGAKVSISNW